MGTVAGGSSDEPVKDMRRRLDSILLLSVPLAVYLTVFGSGLERLLWGPAAVGFAGFFVLSRWAGTPVHSLARWIFGIIGAVLVPTGVLLGAGVAYSVVGAWGQDSAGMLLLVAMVALPVAGGLVLWGSLLVGAALRDPATEQALEIDVDAARRSEAARRFDALHGPKRTGTEGEHGSEHS